MSEPSNIVITIVSSLFLNNRIYPNKIACNETQIINTLLLEMFNKKPGPGFKFGIHTKQPKILK